MEKKYKFVIHGGRALRGSVDISGAKNAAVAIIPAAVMTADECIIDNLPAIHDVDLLGDILAGLGAEVERLSPHTMRINASGVNTSSAMMDKVRQMRASYYLLGALLGRFGRSEVALPGGCDIGERPMDQHLKGFEALGATVIEGTDYYTLIAENGLKGTVISLDMASVGATINIMLAAVLAEGTTVINNAAREPHVVDLANFLSAMGAKIKGAGTDSIRIKGVEKLHGCHYSVIPDQIEAGTFMIVAAATGGDVMVQNVIPPHLDSITDRLREAGCMITELDDAVHVIGRKRPRGIKVKTRPYPGFPTDMQQPISAYLTCCEGESKVTETIYENRFQYTNELAKMGADIDVVDNKDALIRGVEGLKGKTINALDLRAGAAMVIAGLMADGETVVRRIHYIDRGYEFIEEKLRGLGADIVRVLDTDPDAE